MSIITYTLAFTHDPYKTHGMFWNIPNILTMARIAILIPVTLLFFVEDAGAPHGSTLATWMIFWLYVLSSLTDFFDGWWARKFNQTTPFGTFLDPISDKIFVGAFLVLLVAFDRLQDWWMVLVILIFTREFLVSGLREFLGPHNVKMPVTKLAKWKTATQMFSLGFLVLAPVLDGALMAGQGLLALATALTLITGWDYMKTGLDAMRKMR